jgi:hypothetical protein
MKNIKLHLKRTYYSFMKKLLLAFDRVIDLIYLINKRSFNNFKLKLFLYRTGRFLVWRAGMYMCLRFEIEDKLNNDPFMFPYMKFWSTIKFKF